MIAIIIVIAAKFLRETIFSSSFCHQVFFVEISVFSALSVSLFFPVCSILALGCCSHNQSQGCMDC